MKKTFLDKVKNLLLAERREILKQVEQDIDIDTEGDETDQIQGKLLIELTNHLNTRNAAKLAQIEFAIKCIEDNNYGKCQDCEELIPEKRLLHNPHFQTCVSCSEEREKEDKLQKRF
jgi:DnaK suppressor protein